MQGDDDIRLGTRVHYKGAWGAGSDAMGTITGKGKKCGRTVYDVALDTGGENWGYREQFATIGKTFRSLDDWLDDPTV